MLLCVCSVIDHRWRQNVVRTKSRTRGDSRVCHALTFLPHFDVLCDLLLNRRTAHGLYLFYITKKRTTSAFFISNPSQLLESWPLPSSENTKSHLTVYTKCMAMHFYVVSPLWLVILNSVWQSIAIQLAVSYTLLPAVPWRTGNSCWSWRNDGASQDNLHFDDQIRLGNFLFASRYFL